jgi:hypothetical protein
VGVAVWARPLANWHGGTEVIDFAALAGREGEINAAGTDRGGLEDGGAGFVVGASDVMGQTGQSNVMSHGVSI